MTSDGERPVRVPPSSPDLRIEAPPSKSVAARALVAASLAPGLSTLRRLPEARDTHLMMDGLRRLGVSVEPGTRPSTARIRGADLPLAPGTVNVDAADAGTVLRFLMAVSALGPGPVTLDGTPRMRERPVGPLCEALTALGLRADARGGVPPVRVSGGPPRGGEVRVSGEVSSQFASALLLVGPVLEEGLRLEITGRRVSVPYETLTVRTMERFGAVVCPLGPGSYRVEPGGYRPARLAVEGDWSSACFPLAAAAITGGRITVTGLDPESAQPDRAFPAHLAAMGVSVGEEPEAVTVEGPPRRGLEADLGDSPDAVPALAAVAAVAPGPSLLRGIAHLRVKESDRLAGLEAGLTRLGAQVEALEDGLRIRPAPLRGAAVDSRGDHRLAMAFAVLGLAVEGVRVSDPGCVRKSYPGFWDHLARIEAG